MKITKIIYSSFFILLSCTNVEDNENQVIIEETIEPLEIIGNTINMELLTYKRETSTWALNDIPYNGYAISKFDNDSLKQKFGILNGRKQNSDSVWFSSGTINSITHYHKGKLHGEKSIWSENPNYTLIAKLNYKLGKAHGIQEKWYTTGEVFQILNLEMGKEEGIQQAYRKNGVLFANYEAKNGRIFGLKKAALCFGLEDQKIKDDE